MAIIKGPASATTLTRTLAANIIAGLGDNHRQFGDAGPALPDGGDDHDNIDGGLGHDTPTGRAVDNGHNEGEVAGRPAISAVPLFNIFRPF